MKFLGIDVHLNILTIAELDEKLNINLIKNMTIDEFNNYIENAYVSVIGVDAPCKLNQGLMDSEEYRIKLGRKINGHYNKKVSEYELSRRGINPFSTPNSIEVIKNKTYLSWMETGFKAYEILEKTGYKFLNEININENSYSGIAEVFPHASFTVIAGRLLSNKNTAEGIDERINILEEQGIRDIKKYFKHIKKSDKDDFLDALIAAFTVFKISNGEGMFVGDVMEGQIALPVNEIKDSYKRTKEKRTNINEKKQDIIFSDKIYEYKVKHCDSVLWLKHFIPVDTAPDIRVLLNFRKSKEVKVSIVNENNDSIDITLINMKNRNDGLKVSDTYRKQLKNFWGSHGDGKEYILRILLET